jgi:hypothetical protein
MLSQANDAQYLVIQTTVMPNKYMKFQSSTDSIRPTGGSDGDLVIAIWLIPYTDLD